METKVNIIICTVVLCILNIGCTSTQGLEDPSFSTVFIDENAGNSQYIPKDQPTMGRIEDVLGSDHKGSKQPLERLSDYLKPIFIELQRTDALRKISAAFSLEYEAIVSDVKPKRIDFLALSPLLDAIERTEEHEPYKELEDVWTEDFRGFALSSLISALRFGACIELGLKLINGDDTHSSEYCERPDYGKIRDWHYNERSGTGSFHLDDMKVDLYKLSLNPTTNEIDYELVKQWSYDWHVYINAPGNTPGYYQAERMDLADYQLAEMSDPDVDPFEWISAPPGGTNLPTLPAAAKKTPDGNIWPSQRDLTHRLFAYGPAIEVKKIERTLYKMRLATSSDDPKDIHTDPISPSRKYVRDVIEEGPITLASEHPYMKSSTESCVDIMFNLRDGYPVSIDDHPFSTDQRGWCLGRCTKPVIQNSK